MSSGGVLPGREPSVRAEVVHESGRTRVTRLFLPRRTVIRKQPLGPDAERRVRHETSMLERLRGVAGVVQLAEAPRDAESVVLDDAGCANVAELGQPLAVADLLRLGLELGRAVTGMHHRGVMHRDITPANIVVSGDGTPTLVDFALASSLAEIRPEFTHHTGIVGTLGYLAPEQTAQTGRLVDHRADLYALGATLYELATGEPPFGSGDPLRLVHDHLARVPVPPTEVNPAIPGLLSAIIMHLLEKEPDNRYQTADGLVYDLDRVLEDGTRPDGAGLRVGGHDVPLAVSAGYTQLYAEFRRIAGEQAALRRVATLVAQGARPEQVFAAVAEEAGRLLVADFAVLVRYDGPQQAITVIGTWTSTGALAPTPVGSQLPLGGQNVTTLVYRTGQPARIDYDDAISGAIGQVATHDWGLRSSVGVPISIEGRLWGVMVVAFTREELLPADTEARLAGFTELVATAVANAQARGEAHGFAEEQAALRRVATLVARTASPEEVFAAVTAEAGRLLTTDLAVLARYDPDGTETILGAWAGTGASPVAVGTRVALGGRDVSSLVFQTSRPARIDGYSDAAGSAAALARELGTRAAVGVPISVAGRLWGVMIMATRFKPLPADTEARLAGFTDLAATAVANAQAQAELAASRARIVAVDDAARRRIQRNLHDGAQQRLVTLSLGLEEARAAVPPGADELAQRLEGSMIEVAGVLEEVREVARGLHPAVLTEGGLRPALRALARRSAVPVSLEVQVKGRLPEPVQVAAYYTVAEALTNIAKYAGASAAEVEATVRDDVLQVRVRDDGRGGADFGRGSGLAGLKDRIEALGGRISLHSPPGAGTTVQIALPLSGPTRPTWES
jgi:signal transduction histidine kinase